MTREQRLHDMISVNLHPIFLSIQNETHLHHVPANAESHFKVIIVADQFDRLSRIERHRKVNQLLKDEFDMGLHALSLHLYSPLEWQAKEGKVQPSPVCKGGGRKTESNQTH